MESGLSVCNNKRTSWRVTPNVACITKASTCYITSPHFDMNVIVSLLLEKNHRKNILMRTTDIRAGHHVWKFPSCFSVTKYTTSRVNVFILPCSSNNIYHWLNQLQILKSINFTGSTSYGRKMNLMYYINMSSSLTQFQIFLKMCPLCGKNNKSHRQDIMMQARCVQMRWISDKAIKPIRMQDFPQNCHLCEAKNPGDPDQFFRGIFKCKRYTRYSHFSNTYKKIHWICNVSRKISILHKV